MATIYLPQFLLLKWVVVKYSGVCRSVDTQQGLHGKKAYKSVRVGGCRNLAVSDRGVDMRRSRFAYFF